MKYSHIPIKNETIHYVYIMKPIELINNSKWVFLESCFVHENSELELIFKIGKESINREQTITGKALPIIHNPTSPRYRVIFKQFIAYSILDESYDNINNKDELNIDGFRVFKKSNFLNYVRTDTISHQIVDKEILHYFFYTQNQLINVAATKKPEIIKL